MKSIEYYYPLLSKGLQTNLEEKHTILQTKVLLFVYLLWTVDLRHLREARTSSESTSYHMSQTGTHVIVHSKGRRPEKSSKIALIFGPDELPDFEKTNRIICVIYLRV